MNEKNVVAPDEGKKTFGRGSLTAAAALVVVVLTVGIVAVLNRGGDPDVVSGASSSTTTSQPATTTTRTTTTVATTTTTVPEPDAVAVTFVGELVAEINAGDREAVDSTLASVPELKRPSGGWDGTLLAPYVQFWIEVDSTVEILGCRKSDDGTTRCNIERYSDAEPWAPLAWTGQLVVTMNGDSVEILNLMGFDSDPWKAAGEAFRYWVRQNRNDDLYLIYNNDDPVERAEAQARLLAEYLELTG